MAEALANPNYGYYTTQNPIGKSADFITSPEISQMFGELIGLWCIDIWNKMGSPASLHLVEIGPGKGTLMRDAINASAVMPKFQKSIQLHLVETSPVLRARQRSALNDVQVTWHTNFYEVPDGPMIIIANELFDALPIHQFQRTAAAWQERLVDIEINSDQFKLVLGPVSGAFATVSKELKESPIGSVVEVSPDSINLMHTISSRILTQGGAALIIDYGSITNRPRDTLQGVVRHNTHNVFQDPGKVDLSAHVDFETLGYVAEQIGAAVWGPELQGAFLQSIGIQARAAQLKKSATPNQAKDIDSALERLINPGQMGTLFKVLAVTSPEIQNPAGFQTQ